MKNYYIGKNCQKGGLGQFTNVRGGLSKKEGVVFLRGVGVDIPTHTMILTNMLKK